MLKLQEDLSEAIDELEQFKSENKTQANQIKELAQVNATWEKYAYDIKKDQEEQTTVMMQNLKEERDRNEELRNQDLYLDQGISNVSIEAAKKLEEDRHKANDHARFLSNKVDELKRTLKAEQTRVKELELQTKNLERVKYLEKAVQNLRIENGQLKQQASGLGLAPMDFQPSVGNDHEECRKKMKEYETQNEILKQQITIFKEDFDSERNDREKSQSELSEIRKQFHTLDQQLHEKTLEVNALRETRDHQNATIEGLQIRIRDLTREYEQGRPSTGDKYNIHFHQPVEETVRVPSSRVNYGGLLTEHQKKILRQQWTVFCSNLRTDDITIQLYSEGVMSHYQKQEIDTKLTSNQKAEYLMSYVIMKGSQKDLNAFKKALLHSNQQHLAQLLPVNDAGAEMPQYRQFGRSDLDQHNYQQPTAYVPTAMASSTWRCMQCTFENLQQSTVCPMCGNKRMDSNIATRGIDQCDNHLNYRPNFRYSNRIGDLEED